MIFTGFPVWFVIFCLVLAAGYAFGLYFRERKSEIPAGLRTILGIFRFLAVFAIAFLLLSPFIKTIDRTREKPVVVIAQDNSGSVVMNADSSFYRQEYLRQLDDLSSSLGTEFNVKRFLFGEKIQQLDPGSTFEQQAGFDQKLTDISGLFSYLAEIYSKRNLGAVIIATDGIYNSGYNPVYQVSNMGFPVYTLALGDTSQKRDLILSHIAFNRLVYLDNKFPLRVTINAYDCQGSTTTLRVSEKGKTLFSREITIDRSDFTTTLDIILRAEEVGLKRYRVSLSSAGDELSLDNNSKDIFIEVLDARNKILILYHSPHPDIAALKQAAETNLNYEVEDIAVKEFTGQMEAYNLVIMHQLPALDNPAANILSEIKEKEIPVLFILGTQTDLSRVNQWEGGLNIISPRNLFEEALPVFNNTFSLFTLDEETRRLFNGFPPLNVPNGNYQVGSLSNVLLYQRIGSLETSRPLIVLEQNLQYRYGWITGEGIWRWRLMDYVQTGNHDAFNQFFIKVFQYLSLKEQKKNIRVYHKSSIPEYENVTFDAEVYNMSYELINDPELEMNITDEEGKQFPFTFSRSLDAYHLDAGKFAPGNYTYKASAQVGSDLFSTTGRFSVTNVDLESLQLVADHNLTRALSEQSLGTMLAPDKMGELENILKNSTDIKPVIYTSKRLTELVNMSWLLIAILALLTVEWFVRKWSGSY